MTVKIVKLALSFLARVIVRAYRNAASSNRFPSINAAAITAIAIAISIFLTITITVGIGIRATAKKMPGDGNRRSGIDFGAAFRPSRNRQNRVLDSETAVR